MPPAAFGDGSPGVDAGLAPLQYADDSSDAVPQVGEDDYP